MTMTTNSQSARQPLDKSLRKRLADVVIEAREIAEQAALQALERLGVGDAKPANYLSESQRRLRTRLRAHGRQLGDEKAANDNQAIKKLVTEVAYEHWHRMLFARFLEQNSLLMYDEHTPLTLGECSELVQDESLARDDLERGCETGWELAGVLASKMLPQIFRIDSPVFELEFAPEHQRSLEKLVTSLATETFQAQDSLGWVYQFWQSKRKEEVNKSEVKIGANELSPVTQLFTEPYMVSFLLDNSLGAWWAALKLSESDLKNAESEEELRKKAAIQGVPLEYLRFVKQENGAGHEAWTPAAGTFDAWPEQLADLKTLDPCCGSGHFLVAAFLMLVPMRMERDGLSAPDAVDAVLRENIHGLELDQRCVELAAFALALTAWRFPGAGGYRPLPELHLACTGLSVSVAKEEWKQLGLGKHNLAIALDWMHDTFRDAPVLGSLLNPAKADAAKLVKWGELSSTLKQALGDEQQGLSQNPQAGGGEAQHEAAVVAQGLAKAATLLADQYQWVITNVPYLARGKQSDRLRDFCERHYPAAKNDLATVFLDRCLELCSQGGTSSIVLPQNWLFLTSYKKFREKLLKNDTWHLIARLGPGAFETISGEVVKAILINMSRGNDAQESGGLFGDAEHSNLIRGVDVSDPRTAAEKANQLVVAEVKSVDQAKQLENPDARIVFEDAKITILLNKHADGYKGLSSGDLNRFIHQFWEADRIADGWVTYQGSVRGSSLYDGRSQVLLWDDGHGAMVGEPSCYVKGRQAWGHQGITVTQMGRLPATLFEGDMFDENAAAIIPFVPEHRAPVWCFIQSDQYNEAVRELDSALKVTNKTLVKVPFDVDYWSDVSKKEYPNGLPKPYTNEPTQWIFHGHPCGSVVWDEEQKWTTEGPFRTDDTVLQVAVARLLGYRWPAELDNDMELADEQREWVKRCQNLEAYVDDDGIACLSAVRGEKAADQRLESLLEAAYGDSWTASVKNQLLDAVGSKSFSLWLRDKFFEQHCKLFQNRPFIWHIWDGLKDGFSALVNYHQLDKSGLERLIYTYLGDWIRTQQALLAGGEDGAQERLLAAETLKGELEAILEGEAPYDIFVRWKPLEEQPVGWTPDLNDGVRLNIRPFMNARDLGKKGAGILRVKPNIKWAKDRGKDVETAPWYRLGLEYGEKEGARINDHHLPLAEKLAARSKA